MPTLAEYRQRFQASAGAAQAQQTGQSTLGFNRLSGMTPNNWMEYAADEVQRHQEDRDTKGLPRLTAQEQVGITDAFRKMVGFQPVLAERNYLQERLQQTSEANPLLGYSRSMMGGLGQTGASVAGLVSPEAGSQLRYGMRGAYGDQPVDTVAGKVGGFLGQTLPSVIYMAGGPAGLALAGATGAGGARTDILEAGASQAMPWWKEAAVAAGHGVVETGTEALGAGLARIGGRILKSAGPAIAAAYRAAGKPGITAALRSTILPALGKAAQFELTALGEGGEEALSQFLGNAIDMGTWDPNRTLGQGVGEAFRGGWAGQHLLGAIGAGVPQGPQPQQTPAPLTPSAGPEIYQPANVMNMLEQFAKDPEIPDAAKVSVLQQIQAAQQAGASQEQLVDIVRQAAEQVQPQGDVVEQAKAVIAQGQEAVASPENQPLPSPVTLLTGQGKGDLRESQEKKSETAQNAIMSFEDWAADPANGLDQDALADPQERPAYLDLAQRLYARYVAQQTGLAAPGATIPAATPSAPPQPKIVEPAAAQPSPAPATDVVEQARRIIEGPVQEAAPTPTKGVMKERARARKLLRAAKAAKKEARTDELTGLGNRRAYQEAKQNLARRHEETNKPGSIIIFDAANLKAANEKYGYEAGNKMLADIGGKLRKTAGRERDVVVTRQGGDEFAVFLPDTDNAGAAVVRDRIEKAVGRKEIAPGVTTFLTGGIGTVSFAKGIDMTQAEFAAEDEMKARKAKAKAERGEAASREAAVAAVKGTMAQRAKGRKAKPKQESKPATPVAEGPRGSQEAEAIYNAALRGRLVDLDEAGRKRLAEANTREGQDQLVGLAREGNLDSAMILTASNMGNIRNAAKRVIAELQNKNMTPRMTEEELTGEGAEIFLLSVQGKPSLTTTGKASQAGDIDQFDASKGNLATFLIGRRTRKGVAQRMYDLALGYRPGVETKEARKGESPREIPIQTGAEKGRVTEVPEEAAKAREDRTPEDKPLSEEGLDLVARARKLIEEGKTEEEVRAWVKEQAAHATEQGILFQPEARDMAAEAEYELSDDIIDHVVVREANADPAAKQIQLIPVKPKTELEHAMLKWAKDHGIASIGFFVGKGTRGFVYWESKGRHPIKRLMLRAGASDFAQMAATVGHEASHYTGLDQALRVSDSKVAAEAIERYAADYEEVFGARAAKELVQDHARLAREAAATLIGDAFLDPMVRRRLQMEDATLWQKIVDAIRYAVKKMTGKSEIIDQVLQGFRSLETTPTRQGTQTMFQPEGRTDPAAQTDVNRFHADMARVLAEQPKQTGRPELANPMETEATRRLMDYVDELRKQAGVPAHRTDQQVRQEADRLLSDPKKKAAVLEAVRAGRLLGDTEVLAAQDILNEQADKVFKEKSLSSILDLQRTGSGYRDVGTGTARALRIRYDKIKTPAQRLREFAAGALSTLPDDIQRKVKGLEDAGKTSEADRTRMEYGERGLELLENWAKHGIDIDQLTEEQAGDARVYSKIVKDLGRLRGGASAWDVVHEYRRNALMFAPLTLLRNMAGGFYSVADTFVTKPLARTIRGMMGKDVDNETVAAIQAWGSRTAWMHALSNAANTLLYEVPQLETQIGIRGGKTPMGMAETEIYSSAAITGESTARAVEAAMKIFGNDAPSIAKAGKTARALVSGLGRFIRSPQVINAAVDELFKTLHLYGEVGSHAARIGKEYGLKVGSEEMARFIDEQVANTGSIAWSAAIDSGETWRASFQGEASRVERFILDATSGKYGTIGQLLRLIVPFRKTPVQLAGQAAMHIPGVGLGRMAQRLKQSREGGVPYGADEFSRHAAQQLIGILGLGMVWNLVGDDEDDDKNKIKLTGPASYSRQERQERVTREQAEPSMAVRIGGKWYNYNYVEPVSQWVGTLAAIVGELKRGSRTGEPSEAAKRLWRKLGGMYADQTYLRGLGDLAKMIYDYESFTAERMSVNFAGSWLPNIVDTALRDADPYIRERRVGGEKGERASFGKQVAREMFPTGNLLPPPKVDFFGNDIEVPGQKGSPATLFMVRLLSPIQERQTLTGKQGDIIRMLINWNKDKASDDPEARWFQEPGRKVQVRHPGSVRPIQEDLNEEEYYLMAKMSGTLAASMIETRTWNVEKPSQQDIVALENIFQAARNEARGLFTAARQAKAKGQTRVYNELLSRAKARIAPLSAQGIGK